MKYFKKIVILLFMIFMFGSFEISYANDNGSNKLLTDDVVNKLVWEDLEISDENLNYILNLDNEEQQKIESERLIYSNYKYRHSLRFFYDGYKELNTAEQYLVKIKPLEALVVRNAAIYSSNKTKKMYGESNADDDSDAFRHSYWNALMVKRLTHMKDIGLITRGVEVAKLFADAHEEEFIQTSLAKEMDLYNN